MSNPNPRRMPKALREVVQSIIEDGPATVAELHERISPVYRNGSPMPAHKFRDRVYDCKKAKWIVADLGRVHKEEAPYQTTQLGRDVYALPPKLRTPRGEPIERYISGDEVLHHARSVPNSVFHWASHES